MVYLNFSDLSEKAQGRLLTSSKEYVKRKYGKDIIEYASLHNTDLDRMLEEEAVRNLYSYKYVFTI